MVKRGAAGLSPAKFSNSSSSNPSSSISPQFTADDMDAFMPPADSRQLVVYQPPIPPLSREPPPQGVPAPSTPQGASASSFQPLHNSKPPSNTPAKSTKVVCRDNKFTPKERKGQTPRHAWRAQIISDLGEREETVGTAKWTFVHVRCAMPDCANVSLVDKRATFQGPYFCRPHYRPSRPEEEEKADEKDDVSHATSSSESLTSDAQPGTSVVEQKQVVDLSKSYPYGAGPDAPVREVTTMEDYVQFLADKKLDKIYKNLKCVFVVNPGLFLNKPYSTRLIPSARPLGCVFRSYMCASRTLGCLFSGFKQYLSQVISGCESSSMYSSWLLPFTQNCLLPCWYAPRGSMCYWRPYLRAAGHMLQHLRQEAFIACGPCVLSLVPSADALRSCQDFAYSALSCNILSFNAPRFGEYHQTFPIDTRGTYLAPGHIHVANSAFESRHVNTHLYEYCSSVFSSRQFIRDDERVRAIAEIKQGYEFMPAMHSSDVDIVLSETLSAFIWDLRVLRNARAVHLGVAVANPDRITLA